jgi:hypothetical protein
MGLTFNLGRVSPSVFTDSSLNVGIGAAPSGTYKLEVTGTAKVSSTLLLGGALSGTSATFSGVLTFANGVTNNIGSDKFFLGSGGYNYLYCRSTGLQILNQADTAALVTILNGGNVGIGTTSPNRKLEVSSSDVTDGIRLYSTATSGEGLSLEWMSGFGPKITADIESDASGTGGNLTIRVADTSAVLQDRLHINNAGDVGINETSANIYAKLQVTATSGATLALANPSAAAASVGSSIWFYGTTGYNTQGVISTGYDGTSNVYAYMTFSTRGPSTTERMRITSGGNVLIGSTSDQGTWKAQVTGNLFVRGNNSTSANTALYIDNSSGTTLFYVRNDGATQINGNLSTAGNGQNTIQDANPFDTGSRIVLNIIGGTYNAGSDTSSKMIRFQSNNFTEIGYIIRNGGNTISYVSSSDYRLKEDLKEFSGLDLISKIKTYDFKWIGSEHRDYGVIAHELKEVVPNIVSGEKDDIYEETGQIKPQGLDYGKLTPILVKAIQELSKKVTELEKLVATK